MRRVGQISVLLFTLAVHSPLWAQDRAQATLDIEVLASDSFAGRGYVDQGELKAANYIAERMQEAGLQALNDTWFQHFSMPVNTIPNLSMSIDGAELEPGVDYMVSPVSPSATVSGKLFPFSLKMLHSEDAGRKARRATRKGWIPVIPVLDPNDSLAQAAVEEIKRCARSEVLIFLKDRLVWSVGHEQTERCHIWLLSSAFDPYAEEVTVTVQASLIPDYQTQNVVGRLPGTGQSDSLIILCGHYDHLGQMGEAIFHGANDNASGIAMLLDLASYFADHPQRYDVLFVAFGGEEAGLVGSHYFVEHPPEGISLDRIRFVFNMDLMGNGQEGATIVNGKIFTQAFDRLVQLNTEGDYLPVIKARGKSANSDHYFFSEAGIPAFFIYLMGPYSHYHIPLDNAQELVLTEYYERAFYLIRDFIIDLNALN